jgi:hypothetical protein
MQELIIEPTHRTPSIRFSPSENVFYIRGESSPEDVRKMYYPVIEWVKEFVAEVVSGGLKAFNNHNSLKFQIDLTYFNSSSAKFLYDLIMEFQKLPPSGVNFIVEWYYEKDDIDMKDGGVDFSYLVAMDFTFIPKSS